MTVTPNTEIKLCVVPFAPDYAHVMDFANTTEQTAYFQSKMAFSFDYFTYQREERSIKVPIEIDRVLNCNYVMYRNENFNQKWFYAFILEKRYINPETTELIIAQDVWQTWLFDLTFKPSFIERQHEKRWNTDGSPVINTIDEGLNYGTDYITTNITQFHPQNEILFLVIASKRTLHKPAGAPTTILPAMNGVINPLSFYIHPMRRSGDVPPTTIDGTASGITTIHNVLEAIYSDTTAVNDVVSICLTDYIGQNVSYDGTVHLDGSYFQSVPIGDTTNKTIYVYDLPSYEPQTKNLGDKYSGYNTVTESKLLMFPYTQTVLSDGKGNQVTLKNEYILQNDLEITVRGSIGTSNKVAYYVENYKNSNPSNSQIADLENAVINNDPNDIPVLTEHLSAFIQGNKNSLNLQKAQNTFNQKIDFGKIGVSALTGIGAGAGAGSIIPGVGTLAGGIVGGVAGGVGGLLNALSTVGGHDIKAKSMMTKQQDIDNTPPSLSGLGANTQFDFGNDISGIYIIKKQIKVEYINQLTNYFKMYGYKVNKLEKPNFKTREHFNYIKTVGCNIQSDIPMNDLQTIKGIFDAGVTIWHTSDVGNYSLSNSEVI